MYDIDIILTILNKENYDRFKPYIKKHNVSSVTENILDVLDQYWDNYPGSTTVSISELKHFFFICKGHRIKDAAMYEAAFNNLDAASRPAAPDILLKHLVEVDYATRIADQATGHILGTSGKSLTNIRGLLDECDNELGAATDDTDVFVSPSLAYLDSVTAGGGLNWRLKEFNISLGPLRKGDFLILGARPEAGKTTMMASEASFMLPQLKEDEHIIWINNEEGSNKVMTRVIQAFNGVTTKDLLADRSKYESAFLSAGGNRFLIVDDDTPYNSVGKIKTLFTKYKPGLIIFDQLDKVKGYTNDREDLRIGELYKWARELAKLYCPVIAVSQLSGEAEGEKWLHMDLLRGSKTDKPGEADAIILIGDARDGTLNRYISIAKNKLIGGPDTLETHRHGSFIVDIDPSKARYVSHWK